MPEQEESMDVEKLVGRLAQPKAHTDARVTLGLASREIKSSWADADGAPWVVVESIGEDYTYPLDQFELVPQEPARDELLVREHIVAEGGRIIVGDRQATYGDATESFTRLARLWSPILGVDLTAQQVALCLVQLKVSRAITSPQHADSYVDMVGYSALAAEVAGVKP